MSKQLTKSDLDGMTPAEIMKANKEGRLSLLKTGGKQLTIAQFSALEPTERHEAYKAGQMRELFGLADTQSEDGDK